MPPEPPPTVQLSPWNVCRSRFTSAESPNFSPRIGIFRIFLLQICLAAAAGSLKPETFLLRMWRMVLVSFLCAAHSVQGAARPVPPHTATPAPTHTRGMTNDYLVLRAAARAWTCLRVHFCTVCVLTAGSGGERKKREPGRTLLATETAVNNRNSIKLAPVSGKRCTLDRLVRQSLAGWEAGWLLLGPHRSTGEPALARLDRTHLYLV